MCMNDTFAMELDKPCKECAASNDSKNDASAGFSIVLTCTWRDSAQLRTIRYMHQMSLIVVSSVFELN